jgi:hypothetical protein
VNGLESVTNLSPKGETTIVGVIRGPLNEIPPDQ